MALHIWADFDYEYLKTRIKWDVDSDTNCWNITSHKKPTHRDYLTITINRKVWSINRAVYIAVHASISRKKVVRHTCDNPMCVNPEHLIAGTKKDNTQDMLSRGRESKWSKGKGRDGKRRVLTTDQINLIKASDLSSYKLAEIYPVSAVQIRRIKNGSRCVDI